MLTKEASCRRQSAVAGRGATKDPPGVTKSKKNQQTQPRHGSIRIVDVGFFPKSPNGFKRTTACLTAHCLAPSPMHDATAPVFLPDYSAPWPALRANVILLSGHPSFFFLSLRELLMKWSFCFFPVSMGLISLLVSETCLKMTKLPALLPSTIGLVLNKSGLILMMSCGSKMF